MKKIKAVTNAKDLKQLQKDCNLSVTELCAKLEISTQAYYNLCKDTTKEFSPKLRARLDEFIKTWEDEKKEVKGLKLKRGIEYTSQGLLIHNFSSLAERNRVGLTEAIGKFYLQEKDPFFEFKPLETKGEAKK